MQLFGLLKTGFTVVDFVVFFSRGDDVDYQENFLKPELIKFLVRLYASKFEENDPAKISLRDKILECAKLATEVSIRPL